MPDPVATTVGSSRATTTRLMVPTDVNFAGNVFGGHILAEIDRVAYITATRHSQASCVTASFDRVDFLSPVHVGDVVDFDAELTFVGTSSMEVWVRVRAESTSGGDPRPVGEAFVTMVAVDAAGRPIPVPPLLLETVEERSRFEEGRRRMEERRRTRHRRNP
ncbi:MAG TPA: acyl-CoA thioesterase [Thermoplasmata archaeon]|nr:acyl-CoA thioesterase [Thermoplasmata archaeon]